MNRPDIPALNSVHAGRFGGSTVATSKFVACMMVLLVVLLSASAGIGAWRLGHLKPVEVEIRLAVILAAMSIGAVVAAIKIARWEYCWITDDRGLLAKGLLRERFLEWSELQSFEMTEGGRMTLHTPGGDCTVSVQDWDCCALGASILQHRGWHRLDHHEPDMAGILAYWDPVPEHIPREIDWVSADPPSLRKPVLWAAFGVALFLPSSVWQAYQSGVGRVIFFMAAPMFALAMHWWRHFLWPVLASPRKVNLRDEFVEFDTIKGTVQWRWSDVRLDGFWMDNSISLTLRPPSRRHVNVPFTQYADGREELTLAIIRRLREAGNAVPIPEGLR